MPNVPEARWKMPTPEALTASEQHVQQSCMCCEHGSLPSAQDRALFAPTAKHIV
jgi:hypothetical protein